MGICYSHFIWHLQDRKSFKSLYICNIFLHSPLKLEFTCYRTFVFPSINHVRLLQIILLCRGTCYECLWCFKCSLSSQLCIWCSFLSYEDLIRYELFYVQRQDIWSLHVRDRLYKPLHCVPCRYSPFMCRCFVLPSISDGIPLLKNATLALSRYFYFVCVQRGVYFD